MPAASAIRFQVESALAHRIPYALTPVPRQARETLTTRIESIDGLLQGGIPVGAISELVGAECSGRTSLALSVIAAVTNADKVTAWVDVSDTLDPLSAAAAGTDLERMLWVRCGVAERCNAKAIHSLVLPSEYLTPKPAKKGLHGGSFGPHPRTETKGLAESVPGLLHPEPRCAEPQPRVRVRRERFEPSSPAVSVPAATQTTGSPWTRLDQALRSTDQLLQGGGFSVIVLDMGSLAPEVVSRVPLATWFRYRAAAERTHTSILLLTQYPCAKSSAALVLELQPAQPSEAETTVLAGSIYRADVGRRRFSEEPPRKPPRRVSAAQWQGRAPWAGRR